MTDVLVLGAGHVAAPLVRYLIEKGNRVTVASRTVCKAEALAEGSQLCTGIEYTSDDHEKLEDLVREHKVTVSLLPYTLHAMVARECIKEGKHLVTTSYVSDEIMELDGRAKKAGSYIMMECGLDPGIDHMSAMKIIHEVEGKGGEIINFESYCGGLPAPESNDNPWGYKFSWSPKGVLLAGKNPAKYLKDGDVIDIPSEELFTNNWKMQVDELPPLEAYPNRNSLPYREKYGIENAETVFRGTLRYPGWCRTMKCIVDLGFTDESERDLSGLTYADLLDELTGDTDLSEYLDIPWDSEPIERMRWLGLLDHEPLPFSRGSPIDVLVNRMLERMDYTHGEKDMIVLHHMFTGEYPSGTREITSTLIDYGVIGGETAMARTVGLPAAVVTDMLLKGEIVGSGVHIPVDKEVYEPVLERIAAEGIVFNEKGL